ncbi:hypothetical protein GCM10012275_63470 [Longimycelium tulufanense]|uniref:4Fe-4S Wbl-type domain-containing protein n=1 Tax=Longimycelium tulufanense TaxID=907463 RepID=A0A8J3CF26_9PSEU|nr:WhiB family transcriptional regulator [Longimycelium tulufanense]GGM84133.1 hypothetical protein GCM10012275_63470 [Longimycelium tulufanense]
MITPACRYRQAHGVSVLLRQIDPADTGGPAQPACQQSCHDPEWWHVEGRDHFAVRARARQVCAGCPVRLVCLVHAARAREYGIWAAMSRRQRQEWLRRLRAITAERRAHRPAVPAVSASGEVAA